MQEAANGLGSGNDRVGAQHGLAVGVAQRGGGPGSQVVSECGCGI